MTVMIRDDGATVVAAVKAQLARRTGIPEREQLLVYAGRQLHDDTALLSEYAVSNGADTSSATAMHAQERFCAYIC